MDPLELHNNTNANPYFPEVGVLNLLAEPWGGPWRSRHQILTRLSQYFHIVWCNPAPSWRIYLRGALPPKKLDDSIVEKTGMSFYYPEWWLPSIGQPRFLARLTTRERLRRAKQILDVRKCRKVVLFIWRPEYDLALDLIDYDISVYRIDDEYTFSPIEKPISEKEQRLITRADQVFIHSPALLQKKGHLNPQTCLLTNGVDSQAYATPSEEPLDLKPIPRPRIGYVGVLKYQLDFPLIDTLVRHHPQWSFVFVGPYGNLGEHGELVHKLSQMPNVHLLGAKPVDLLPSYTQHFDVGLMCYKLNGYTKFIYPLKLHEYLASGRPVVGTPINTLQEFSHIVRLARTPEEWAQAISDSLAQDANTPGEIEARRHVAQQYDWNRLTQQMASILCERLGPEYAERSEKILSETKDLFQ